MRQVSQKTESFDKLLRDWLRRSDLGAETVKERIEAGARLSISHQTVADYLHGKLPHPNRVPALAAAMDIGERRLRRVIEDQRHAAKHVSPDAAATVDAHTGDEVVR